MVFSPSDFSSSATSEIFFRDLVDVLKALQIEVALQKNYMCAIS